MGVEGGPVSRAIAARRSVRRFARRPVARATVRQLVALACTAPAPHHSRPWRFAHVASEEARGRLAESMAEAWRADLERAGESVHRITKLLRESESQIDSAPALLIACLSLTEAQEWPDEVRRAAERDMFVQSLGAALQNLLLAAEDCGMAGYLKGAPLFCQEAVRTALDMPADWEPAFLVLLGYPEDGFVPDRRSEIELEGHLLER